ncbi:hypothetical protein MNB_SV-14-807 [hydrothermal vent metagenome]|uniref:Uncharacterized protein n=1 Tax=hydrothermal vent metagenome TaxID=652676 RepID=A0A1W1CQQ5_9ZZZZ
MNRLINLLLLVVMSFSIAHGVVLNDDYKSNHCSIQEYVAEFSEPIHHKNIHEHDACESHYLFHISFLLPDVFSLLTVDKKILITDSELFTHTNTFPNNTFRPPIV